jgi:hypothetical protein
MYCTGPSSSASCSIKPIQVPFAPLLSASMEMTDHPEQIPGIQDAKDWIAAFILGRQRFACQKL